MQGALEFDTSKPDGMMRKLLDSARIRALGWRPAMRLEDGIERTYQWCLKHDVFEPESATA
ncbi:GDP-L-fucose synthase [compost metagenome]